MKLHYLRVTGFKNLHDCKVSFNPDYSLNAIIGGNGSGKSNLIEAILHILIGLYLKKPPPFDFELQYLTQRREVHLLKLNGRLYIEVDGEPIHQGYFTSRLRGGPTQVYYPELSFVYYSGECKRVRDLIKRYRRHFTRLTRDPETDSFRPLFVESSNDQSKVILLALHAHSERRLLQLLKVEDIIDVSIVLRSPKNFDPKRHEPKLWNTAGAVRKIVAAIDETSAFQDIQNPSGLTQDLFDSPKEYVEWKTYNFHDSNYNKNTILDLARRLSKSGENVYTALEHLNSRGLLVSVNFQLRDQGSHIFEFAHLSEGEKQLIAVLGAIRLTNQQDNLVLLDEPDTHLNPNWSWEYTDLLKSALDIQQFSNSTVLLTSHDPIMISGLVKQQVWIANSEPGSGVQFSNPIRHPRGQGIANILCSSEFYGLPSSLDKDTQKLLDERLQISIKKELTESDRARLRELNSMLEILTPGVSERDPEFVEFLRQKHQGD